jgi:formate hydrogenlyase subunit 4
MTALALAAHLLVLLLLPVLFIGLINRTKAIWAGRRGPPLLQTLFDLIRLVRKRPIYSAVTTPLFRVGPLVLLATTLVSGLFIPLLGGGAPLSFPFDFVAVAYLWGLGRVFLMLSALDTGSSFEGLGASREATYSALVEPVLFLTLGTLVLATGHRSFGDMLHVSLATPAGIAVTVACVVAMFIVLQIESARVPVDDPNTHLELTMIHEVMILDHSGPDLAVIQYAAALKMTLGAALVASLMNPLHGRPDVLPRAAANVALMLVVAVVLGCIESLIARFKLRAVPQYVLVGLVAAFVALLTASWGQGIV